MSDSGRTSAYHLIGAQSFQHISGARQIGQLIRADSLMSTSLPLFRGHTRRLWPQANLEPSRIFIEHFTICAIARPAKTSIQSVLLNRRLLEPIGYIPPTEAEPTGTGNSPASLPGRLHNL